MTTLTFIIALITWIMVIGVNVYLDRNGAKRNYLQVNTVRFMALIFHSIIFFKLSGGNFYKEDIQRNTPILMYYFTSFWLLFDIGLNLVRGRIKEQGGFWKGLLYRDTKEKDSGWIEKIFVKWDFGYYFLKFLAFLGFILSIILIYVNEVK